MASIFPWQDHLEQIEKRGVRKTFTPHKPVSEIQSLLGRQPELMRILGCLDTPGRHVLLYGDRGVGKSSLVKVVPHLISAKRMHKCIYMACDSQTTFKSIARAILTKLEIAGTNESSLTREESSKANISAVVATGEINTKKVTTTKLPQADLSPSSRKSESIAYSN